MTEVRTSPRSSNRVMIMLVVITIVVVAIWAMNGGFDSIQVVEDETPIVSE